MVHLLGTIFSGKLINSKHLVQKWVFKAAEQERGIDLELK